MRITGSTPIAGALPARAAKAYGLKPPGAVQPQADSQSPAPPSSVRGLVAGNVAQPVSFEGTQASAALRSAAPSAVLQMYTRVADKIEAAVGIELGRMIDMQG